VEMVTGFYEHTIRAQAQGKHLVMVVLFDRYPGQVLMLGKKHFSEVQTINDLVGKPVGVSAPGSSSDLLLKYLLRRSNLHPESIPVVTAGTSTMVAAIEQDHIWAGIMTDPFATRLERTGSARVLYDTRREQGTLDVFGGLWPAAGFYTTAEFIAQQPHIVQSVVNAAVKALQFLKQNSPEEVTTFLPESFWGADGTNIWLRCAPIWPCIPR